MSNSAVSAKPWTPTKPSAKFSDDEVRGTTDFQALQVALSGAVPEQKILQLTRDAIEARWVAIRDTRQEELLTEFVDNLMDCDPELAKVNRIIISREEDSLSIEFKRERAPRWTEETYAQHPGTYSKEYRSEKNPDADGVYKLEIGAGRNEDEKVHMRLVEPSGRVLEFPPRNPEKPVNTSKHVEVPSISRLLRDSGHKTTLSVWQYFGLKRAEAEEEVQD